MVDGTMGVRQDLQLRTGRLASFQDSVVRVSDDDENFDGVRHLRAWVCRGVDQCLHAHACVRMRLLACMYFASRMYIVHILLESRGGSGRGRLL